MTMLSSLINEMQNTEVSGLTKRQLRALTRMTAAAKNFKLESVSNSDIAWVAVGASSQE